jgi:hypothetical protein
MLEDELAGFMEIIKRLFKLDDDDELHLSVNKDQLTSEVNRICAKARRGWALASFSQAGPESLGRYFSYHAQILHDCLSIAIADKTFVLTGAGQGQYGSPASAALGSALDLLDHLYHYFGKYIAADLSVPIIFQKRIIESWKEISSSVMQELATENISDYIKKPLMTYVDHISHLDQGIALTYSELNFFTLFLSAMHKTLLSVGHDQINEILEQTLITLNFNHLQSFVGIQARIRQVVKGNNRKMKANIFREYLTGLTRLGNETIYAYDNKRPSLQSMLESWLNFEIIALETCTAERAEGVSASSVHKLRIQLSMPRIACLIKLFHNGNILGDVPLTEVFKFVAEHFSSKQQLCISAESLANEYYSLDMYTAAKVRGLLKDMVDMIDNGFFK